MSFEVFMAVLVAAALHAGWNTTFKSGLDRVSLCLLLALCQSLIALPFLPFVPIPDPSSWGWLLAGASFHTGYLLFLIKSYAYNDLSRAYPLARGSAPLLVALYSVCILQVPLSFTELGSVLCISGGVLLMALLGTEHGRIGGRALFYALGTAFFTAGYTIIDAIGANLAGTASGYILWLFILNTTGVMLFYILVRGVRFLPAILPFWRPGLAAGGMSLGSYWIAVWAFTQAPVALVASLRETSILFALLIAAVFLKEKVNGWRWLSAVLIMAGILLMRL